MPEIDGWEVLGNVLQTQPAFRVIVMTAHGNRDTGSVVKEKGAWAFIEKSCVIDRIKTILRESNPCIKGTKNQKITGTAL